jgi:TM2 domain-containing membrane protein YozV
MRREFAFMIKFLLWCILFVFCWPLALLALLAYPFVWLILLPFRVVGIAVHGALDLVAALIMLPARVIRAI